MVWIAALYLTASPTNGSSSPIWLLVVPNPPSTTKATACSKAATNLEHMAIILLETGRLVLRGAAWRQRTGWRRRARRDQAARHGRNAGVGTPVDQQVGLVRRSHAVGRHLERAGRHGPHQPRRDDDHQLGLLMLETGRA